MRIIKIFLSALAITVLCTGCSKKQELEDKPNEMITNENETEESREPVIIEGEPPKNLQDGTISKLTGLKVTKEVANSRPFAIMLNNIKYASPQSGIGEADILYEALVEGGITRLMGIFENITAKRIGSVRSARHYYASFADEYDAVFVHYGQTKYAVSKISSLGLDTLSGLSSLGTTVFYRDNKVQAPHNAFTSLEGLRKGMEQKKYRTEYADGYEGHFRFYETDTILNSSKPANKVTLKYSNYAAPYFTYDNEGKVYQRFQFGTEHKDKNTGNQLEFKNIIVQLVKEWNIDKNGYQTMDIENSSGKGYYITNGQVMDITWKKNEGTKKMRYYSEDGEELVINPGKTFISIFPDNKTSGLNISQ